MLKIDMHTHIIPAKLPKWAQEFGYGDFIYLEDVDSQTKDMIKGSHFFRRIKDNCWDENLRIGEYSGFNTQVQVVCTIPVLFSYWAKPQDGLKVARFLNDHIADLVARYPKNYVGLGTLPMQDTELAIQELKRCKEIGLVGIQIGSNINDRNLDDADFFPVFEACQELGMAVLVHPWAMMGRKSMQKYWLPWLVGMPAETSRAICSMIFSGIFEKLPDLRVCFCHAGGSFIPTLGRIEHGFNCRPDLVAVDNNVKPSAYLNKFWIDSVTHDLDLLKYLLTKQNADKICFGTDYPFPLGDLEIGKFIEESDLPKEVQETIFSKAALDWLNIDKGFFV